MAFLFWSGGTGALAGFEDGLFASHKGDYVSAFREFRRLAEKGDARSQLHLGIMYEMGLGVNQDYTKAAKWYQQAAIQGDRQARRKLMLMSKKGLANGSLPPVPKNYQGSTTEPRAQYDLGVMYFKGIGTAKDQETAYRWFSLAAHQGYAQAQNDLAVMLSKGFGVGRNNPEAYVWFLKAAEQGLADAQYNLGVMLSQTTTKGMPQHLIIAYMWFEIAARNGLPASRENQAVLAAQMEEEQIEEARIQARKWLQQHSAAR